MDHPGASWSVFANIRLPVSNSTAHRRARVSKTVAADLHGFGRHLTEILNHDTSAFNVRARVYTDACPRLGARRSRRGHPCDAYTSRAPRNR